MPEIRMARRGEIRVPKPLRLVRCENCGGVAYLAGEFVGDGGITLSYKCVRERGVGGDLAMDRRGRIKTVFGPVFSETRARRLEQILADGPGPGPVQPQAITAENQ